MNKNILLTLMSLNTGGAETHAISLARELSNRGYNVVVASAGGCLVKRLEENNIKHYSVPLNTKNPWAIFQALTRLNSVIQENHIDLIHAHARIPAWISVKLGKKYNKPVVTTSHGIYSAGYILKTLTKWGDWVIAVSEDVKEHLIKNFGYPPERITVISNGIDLTEFNSVQKPRIKREEKSIIYISRLEDARGEIAVKLINCAPKIKREFNNVSFTIVGEGNKLNKIKKRAAAENSKAVKPYINVLGARTDIPDLLNLSDIAVGVGRVALEAMAMGKPVVAAGEAGFMGIIDEHNFEKGKKHNFSGRGFARETTENLLAENIKTLLQNEKLCEKLGEFGRNMVKENFSIETMTDKIIQVYRKAGL
ncbi:MAG: hypothetical protein PWQ82_1003 [Thermosediminibacterales bacterium]|nr:hypothetical protein [Thermosediminibacterales bacterium]